MMRTRPASVHPAMRIAAIGSVCAIALLAFPFPVRASPAVDSDVTVHVAKEKAAFSISVEFTVSATALEAWNVLTDYEHMAQIVSNIDSSEVMSRDGNRIEVAQRSHGHAGPIRISVDGVRVVDLSPYTEIHSHLKKGDLKASDFTTRITDEGEVTRVTAHGTIVAAAWVAWAISPAAIEAQTRRQYQELRDEILRRKAR
ncbi:MAG: SRPBCC family protein [Betaproteobacteria bacterium]